MSRASGFRRLALASVAATALLGWRGAAGAGPVLPTLPQVAAG